MAYAHGAYMVVLSLLLLSFTASAGTVVLTGTCIAPPANSSTVMFNIANSGNDTATQMVINPLVVGANISSRSVSIGQLAPGANTTIRVNITGLSEPGVHAGYFTAVYQQGGSIISTVFPCLMPVHASTNSSLELTANSSLSRSGTGTIKVTVYNAGLPVTAKVFLALAPMFNYMGPSSYNVSLAQYASENLTFTVSFPASLQLSYGAGAFATYSSGNESYASLGIFTLVSQGQQQQTTSSQSDSSLLLYGMVAIMATVVLLLAVSMSRRRRRKESGVVK